MNASAATGIAEVMDRESIRSLVSPPVYAVMEAVRRITLVITTAAMLAVGVAAMAWLVATKPTPPLRSTMARNFPVEVISVRSGIETTPILASGSVRPKNQVDVTPQVSGKLKFAHPDLAEGKVIRRGELLFEIDPAMLESQVLQVDAESRALAASLSRHDSETDSLEARLRNADQILAIEHRDYETSKRLYEEEKVGTQRDLDASQRKFLRQKGVVLDLQSKLATMPHRKLESQARLDASQARLAKAHYDLDNSRIHCPFDARVESVHALTSQVVTAFFSIATLTDIEAFEISVGINPADLQWLDEGIRPQAFRDPPSGVDLAPDVAVYWSLPDHEFTWRGRVTRFERMDEVTRTAQAVIEVRGEDLQAADRRDHALNPALSVGMYCRVALPAKPLRDAIRVPRHTIYIDQLVYVFEPDDGDPQSGLGRLRARKIPRLRSMADDVLVDFGDRSGGAVCELKPGELLVVTPLVKPMSGMKVRLSSHRMSTHQRTAEAFGSFPSSVQLRVGDRIPPYLANGSRVTLVAHLSITN